MDCDGTQNGYDIPLTKMMSEITNLPIIASGGAGNLEHIREVLTEGKADAALAASIFHRSQYSVKEVKRYLAQHGIPVRQ
jgi:cyclase